MVILKRRIFMLWFWRWLHLPLDYDRRLSWIYGQEVCLHNEFHNGDLWPKMFIWTSDIWSNICRKNHRERASLLWWDREMMKNKSLSGLKLWWSLCWYTECDLVMRKSVGGHDSLANLGPEFGRRATLHRADPEWTFAPNVFFCSAVLLRMHCNSAAGLNGISANLELPSTALGTKSTGIVYFGVIVIMW